MVSMRRGLLLVILVTGIMSGCGLVPTTGKIIATPFAAVRDAVDVPLVTVTNVFESGARSSRAGMVKECDNAVGSFAASATNLGLGTCYFFTKLFSFTFGAVDYVVCRSIYPDFPFGVSPWIGLDTAWQNLYCVNTRELWGLR